MLLALLTIVTSTKGDPFSCFSQHCQRSVDSFKIEGLDLISMYRCFSDGDTSGGLRSCVEEIAGTVPGVGTNFEAAGGLASFAKAVVDRAKQIAEMPTEDAGVDVVGGVLGDLLAGDIESVEDVVDATEDVAVVFSNIESTVSGGSCLQSFSCLEEAGAISLNTPLADATPSEVWNVVLEHLESASQVLDCLDSTMDLCATDSENDFLAEGAVFDAQVFEATWFTLNSSRREGNDPVRVSPATMEDKPEAAGIGLDSSDQDLIPAINASNHTTTSADGRRAVTINPNQRAVILDAGTTLYAAADRPTRLSPWTAHSGQQCANSFDLAEANTLKKCLDTCRAIGCFAVSFNSQAQAKTCAVSMGFCNKRSAGSLVNLYFNAFQSEKTLAEALEESPSRDTVTSFSIVAIGSKCENTGPGYRNILSKEECETAHTALFDFEFEHEDAGNGLRWNEAQEVCFNQNDRVETSIVCAVTVARMGTSRCRAPFIPISSAEECQFVGSSMGMKSKSTGALLKVSPRADKDSPHGCYLDKDTELVFNERGDAVTTFDTKSALCKQVSLDTHTGYETTISYWMSPDDEAQRRNNRRRNTGGNGAAMTENDILGNGGTVSICVPPSKKRKFCGKSVCVTTRKDDLASVARAQKSCEVETDFRIFGEDVAVSAGAAMGVSATFRPQDLASTKVGLYSKASGSLKLGDTLSMDGTAEAHAKIDLAEIANDPASILTLDFIEIHINLDVDVDVPFGQVLSAPARGISNWFGGGGNVVLTDLLLLAGCVVIAGAARRDV